MYGLVNKAVHDMVVQQFGEETWEAIRTRAGVTVESFVSMEPYPDDITDRLVGAASETLGIDPHAILRAFGEYWTRYTAQEGYGELLKIRRLTAGLSDEPGQHARPRQLELSQTAAALIRMHGHDRRQPQPALLLRA